MATIIDQIASGKTLVNGAAKLALDAVIAAGAQKKDWDSARVIRLFNNGQGKPLEAIMAAIEMADPIVAGPAGPGAEKSIQEQLAELRAENDRLKAAALGKTTVSFKMSVAGSKIVDGVEQTTKGGSLCVYGLGRFPINLSQNAVIALFGNPNTPGDNGKSAELKAFAKANWDKFRTK